jgi:glycosyltransferase involved in cell wall biosynthesis
VDETGAGFVYRTNDELRQALAHLANDSDLREKLRRRARDGFLRLYTAQRHVDRYLAYVHAIRDGKKIH